MAAGTRPRKRHIEWAPIKADYIEGIIDPTGARVFPTYRELGASRGMNHNYIAARGSKEGWLEQRMHLAAKIEDRRRDKRSTILATSMAAFDVLFVRVAERLVNHITARLDKAELKDSPLGIETQELRAIVNATRGVQMIGRLALGDSTENALQLANQPDKPDLSRLTTEELRTLERLTLMARGEKPPERPTGSTLQ